MDFKKIFTSTLPYVLVVAFALVLSVIYFHPVLEGKVLQQSDNIHADGAAKELNDYLKNNPDSPQPMWTNSMFGGMPAYQIKGAKTFNIYQTLSAVSRLYLPYFTVGIVFLSFIGFFFLLKVLKVDTFMSVAGAIAFAFASYNIIIISAGHTTKSYAIALMAPVIAGYILAFRQKYFAGGIVTAIALGMHIYSNHYQITFYLLLTSIIIVICELVMAMRQNTLPAFGKAIGVLVIAAALAIAPNIGQLLTTQEYTNDTIRGETILKSEKNQTPQKGLNKDYALAWSYGVGETFSMMIPNVKGGASGAIGSNKAAVAAMEPRFQSQLAQQVDHYWGDQPFTSGPVYFGAIICFLFILGLFLVDGSIKWWCLAATILSIMLSWGKNFEFFTDIFFNYVPLYNKFRVPAMTLVIAGVTMPLLAILGVNEIIKNPKILKEKMLFFLISVGLTGVLSLLFWMMPNVFFDFLSPREVAMFSKNKEAMKAIIENIESARIAIFKADAIRSFILILIAAAVIWVFSRTKINAKYLGLAMIVLILIDMWPVDKRYLANDHFMNKTVKKSVFQPTPANQFILKDHDPNFRVFNVTRNPFTEVSTSYYHKSIGGYHAAKLRRYQDVIDSCLTPSFTAIRKTLQTAPDSLRQVLAGESVLNMLNAKYVIVSDKAMPVVNFSAFGNAWFAPSIQLVNNANEELAALSTTNLRTTAVVHNEFSDRLPSADAPVDSSRRVTGLKLIKYQPDELTYQAATSKDQLAVFSEVFYSKGWQAYIDKKPVDHIRVNYLLRGLVVPKGTHLVEFKFEPKSVSVGKNISSISSVLLIILILAYIAFQSKQFIAQSDKKE